MHPAGTTREFDDALAASLVYEGLATPVTEPEGVEPPAEDRETKVTGPEETKPKKPASRK